MDEPRKLYRNVGQSMVGGVCAGLADYLRSDVTVVRILAVIAAIVTAGTGLLVYLVMWLLVPPGPPRSLPTPAGP